MITAALEREFESMRPRSMRAPSPCHDIYEIANKLHKN